MTLLIFIIAAVLIGYWLSRSKYQQSIDNTASQIATSSQSWTATVENWWKSSILKRTSTEQFTSWVSVDGQDLLPAEFNTWYNDLSESEKEDYSNQLQKNFNEKGLELKDLVQGKFQNQPARMQVYVEAIVVTSQEFRKTREVEEPKSIKKENSKPKTVEKKTAEKQTSRRRKANPDASEVTA
ncbi:MAG: hypothetical protein ACK2TU_04680 [Anaerolineales bacterium]|jgi:hypothetical protein